MTDHSITSIPSDIPIPADDPTRKLTLATPDDPAVPHIFVVGDTYTVLVSGAQTEGRYCLIDMLVPEGSGPPPHRHDFEENFSLLEGELDFTFRGQTQTVSAPMSVNIPANAPHSFKNTSGKTVHMLCLCTPAGQEEFFEAIASPAASRSSPAPQMSKEEQVAKLKQMKELAPKYRTEILV